MSELPHDLSGKIESGNPKPDRPNSRIMFKRKGKTRSRVPYTSEVDITRGKLLHPCMPFLSNFVQKSHFAFIVGHFHTELSYKMINESQAFKKPNLQHIWAT